MAEKVGLIAILDMSQFNRSFSGYTRALNQMNKQTSQTASGMSGSFVSAAQSIGVTADNLTLGMGSAFLSLGDSVNALVDKIAVGLVAAFAAATVAVTAFVGSGISQAANLEAELDAVNAILGITETQGQAIKDVVLELGLDPDLKVTAAEAAQAIELLARNGLEVNEIIGETGDINDSAAKATILLANAVGADFGLAANIATDAMLIFNKDAGDMMDIVSGITGVVNNSKFTIQDYSLALRNGGAAAQIAGVPLDEFNTLVAAMAEETGRGMRAGTGLANFLARLTPSTKPATEAMRDLGLLTGEAGNAFYDAEGNLKSFAEISRILNQAMFGTKTVMTEVGGRTAEQNELLDVAQAEVDDLQNAYDRAQDTLRDYELGLKGVNLTDDARNKKIAEQQQIMANAQAAMQPYLTTIDDLNSIQGDLVETTVTLTEQQRAVAFETIFGNDAMEAAVAIANEGAAAYTDVQTAMEELNITQDEAIKLVEEGTTKFELLYAEIEKVDAIQQAQQRMANLKGSLEILKGIIETVQLQIGDAFIPVLTLFTDKLRFLANEVSDEVIGFFTTVGTIIDSFVDSLIAGESPLTAFIDSLENAGLESFALNLQIVAIRIFAFIKPIKEFVQRHAVAFQGALEGIASLLAGAAIAARFIAIARAITMLLNPVTALIALAAGIGAAIKTDFAGIGTAFNNIVESIREGSLTWEKVWSNLIVVVRNLWAMVEPQLTAIWQNITNWFAAIDWALIGQILWDTLLTAGGNLGLFILPKLQELLTAIQTWFVTTDWAAVGQSLYDNLLGNANTIGERLGMSLAGLYISITEWIQTTDWTQVGMMLMSAIGNAIVAVLGAMMTYMNMFYQFILGFVESADWHTVSGALVTSIFSALADLFTGVGIVLQGWYQAFMVWVGQQDWTQIGLSIVGFVVSGLSSFVGIVTGTLLNWHLAFNNWLANIDWVGIGISIVFFILDGLVSFVGLIADVIANWFNAFANNVNAIDWYAVGYNVVTFIIEALEFFVVTIPDTLVRWGMAFWTWVFETDWPSMGELVIGMIIEGLETFVEEVVPTLLRWWLAFVNWFNSQDWGLLAKKIIDGIVGGLSAGVDAIKNAINGIIQGAIDAFNNATESSSPSRVFRGLAGNIISGITEGLRQGTGAVIEAMNNMIEDGIKTPFEIISDIGGGFASFASTLTKRFKDIFITPLEETEQALHEQKKKLIEEYETFPDEINDLQKIITETQGEDFFTGGSNLGDLVRLSKGLVPGADNEAVTAAGQLLRLYQQQSASKKEQATIDQQIAAQQEKIRIEQEKIAAIQKQQADLQFLERQLEFLDFLEEHELDASDILGGLQLGINADLNGLLQAMSSAMQQVIQVAEDELGIASPSKVFARIAEQAWTGFTRGTQEQAKNIATTMRDVTRGLVSNVTGGISNVTNNNQRSRSLQLEVSNSFVSQPEITDRSELELLLASFA